MAANEVAINAAPPGSLYGKARHNFKICLKDFLATIRSSTLLLSAAASPRNVDQHPSAGTSTPVPASSGTHTQHHAHALHALTVRHRSIEVHARADGGECG